MKVKVQIVIEREDDTVPIIEEVAVNDNYTT